MSNKIVRIIIFLIYSWYIYISCFLAGLPVILYFSGISGLQEYLVLALTGLPMCLRSFFMLLIIAFFYFNMTVFALFAFGALLYSIPAYWWWQKQTIPRAALLAILGVVYGPGTPFFLGRVDKQSPLYGLFLLLSTCLFYALLYWANEWQKNVIRIANWPTASALSSNGPACGHRTYIC